eukprot:10315347-Ditylum_brightwellii.AAC.1
MHPVKVSTNLVFHNFNKLACPYADFPRNMKGKLIKMIPSNDAVIPLPGDDPLHMVSLPSAILVSYKHKLQSGKVSNEDLRYDSESYYLLMGLWAVTLAYQLSSATGLSGLTQKKDDVPYGQGQLDYIKNLNVTTWLKDHPEWVDPDVAVSPRVSKSLYAATCVQSGVSIQDASVATLNTSPDGRVAHQKIWGAVLETSSTTSCIVMPAVALNFEDILQASGSKNDCAWMFTESLSDFYEEVAQNT